jgi:hypothetical protein
MEERTYILIVAILIASTFFVLVTRAEARAEFRNNCRWQAFERLRKKVGWEPLDAVNARLYEAYRRLNSHE